MRVMVVGASGFIATEIIRQLLQQGHVVVGVARQVKALQAMFSNISTIPCDFMTVSSKDQWLSHLEDIDVVINCVGVFRTRCNKTMWQVHCTATNALFDACVEAGVSNIIHCSALGVDKVNNEYAKSKLAADDYLQSLNCSSTIIRPSLVYGAGSYGGTSLFRGLAALPGFIPLPGRGEQRVQPIHISDLAKLFCDCLPSKNRGVICAVGPQTKTIKGVLTSVRHWLGFGKALAIAVPMCLIKLCAKAGDLLQTTAVNTTGVSMLMQDNIVTESEYQSMLSEVSFKPRSFDEGINESSSHVQDRWHARLYFLKPTLRLSLAFLWIFTAIVSYFLYPHELSFQLLSAVGVPKSMQLMVLGLSSAVDFLLGLALLFNYRVKWVGLLQCIFIVIYTVIISIMLPAFWWHPFAPIAKNIPLLFATLVMMALESNR